MKSATPWKIMLLIKLRSSGFGGGLHVRLALSRRISWIKCSYHICCDAVRSVKIASFRWLSPRFRRQGLRNID